MEKNYSEKEICVFNGVLSLCKAGKKIYNITVQQIADAAGMGKGTLYEYFSSKEEILLNTLIYFMMQENHAAQQIAASPVSFREKMFSLYDLILTSREKGFALVSRFVMSDDVLNIPQLITERGDCVEKVMELRRKTVFAILKSGEKEGKIRLDFDSEYIEMAIKSNFSALNICHQFTDCGISVCQIEQKKETAYTLLLKSLN